MLTATQKAEAKKSLQSLYGTGGAGFSMVYQDGYFANSLVTKYGMSLSELEVASGYRKAKPAKMARATKLRFSWHVDKSDQVEQLEAHVARNGRFYGFVAIRKCGENSGPNNWYLKMLIPCGADHDTNPVPTLAEAKVKAREIVATVIADMQGLQLA